MITNVDAPAPSKNSGRDRGWYKAPNLISDKWGRILGPQSFLVYHVMKSMCIVEPTITSPQATQQDWAEWCGLGVQVFERALKKLVEVGIVDKIPSGNPTYALRYEIKDLDSVLITASILDQIKPLSTENRFHDPLFEADAWQKNMYRESKTPRIKRRIRDCLNGRSTPRSITSNRTRTITGNRTIVRLKDSKTERVFSKENTSVPNGTPIHNHQEQQDGFISISKHPAPLHKDSSSPMLQKIQQKIASSSTGAKRKAKKEERLESLPSREQMPRTLQTWFTINKVTKPTVKTYQRIVELIEDLKQGKFPTGNYEALHPSLTYPYKGIAPITEDLLTKRWTDEEIAELLDTRFRKMVEDVAYGPGNKKVFERLSFEKFVFNKWDGRSWLLDIYARPPQLLRSVNVEQTIEQDHYPDCTYEIAEALEISKKLHPDKYAGIAQNFARIIQFFKVLPADHVEYQGIFKFMESPKALAYSLAEFFREECGWAKTTGPWMLKLDGKLFRKWVQYGGWDDQVVRLPGRKPMPVLDAVEEYNHFGNLRYDPTSANTAPSSRVFYDASGNAVREDEMDAAPPKPTAAETKQKEEIALEQIAPDDIIYSSEEERSAARDRGWKKTLKSTLARLRQVQPARTLKEVCESMARTQREKADTAAWNSYEGF